MRLVRNQFPREPCSIVLGCIPNSEPQMGLREFCINSLWLLNPCFSYIEMGASRFSLVLSLTFRYGEIVICIRLAPRLLRTLLLKMCQYFSSRTHCMSLLFHMTDIRVEMMLCM